MVQEKLADLVKSLSFSTEMRKINWRETDNPNAFQTTFGDYHVLIAEDGDEYDLTIFDKSNKVLDSISDRDMRRDLGESGFELMRDMFLFARRTAMDSYQAIEIILEALRGK
jgi:hypothetical protein